MHFGQLDYALRSMVRTPIGDHDVFAYTPHQHQNASLVMEGSDILDDGTYLVTSITVDIPKYDDDVLEFTVYGHDGVIYQGVVADDEINFLDNLIL